MVLSEMVKLFYDSDFEIILQAHSFELSLLNFEVLFVRIQFQKSVKPKTIFDSFCKRVAERKKILFVVIQSFINQF